MPKEATIETSRGVIKLRLFDKECPKTTANFEKLAGEGFFNGQKWHRVIADFMIQGGDPLSKSGGGRVGTGGPGYFIDWEPDPKPKHGKRTPSKAPTGPV